MDLLTAERVKKAEEDYSVATGLMRRKKKPTDAVCFHCQQAAEKFLKAVLQENRIRFHKTHNLDELLMLAVPAAPPLLLLSNDLKLLSEFAVKFRYPGADATVLQARDAVKAAKRIRAAVLPMLK